MASVRICRRNRSQPMRSESSISQAVSGIAATFSGQLLRPGDAGYDEARRVHNGMVDKKPALIARCRGVADVVDAISIARDFGLPIAACASAADPSPGSGYRTR